jgi:hypothetical protein
MPDNQEFGNLLKMEEALHHYVLGPWSSDHESRPGSAIRQVEYDRDKYLEQRLDTYRTPIKIVPTYLLPSRLLSVMIEYKLAKSFRSDDTARRMVGSFRNRPASRTDDTPLLTKVSQIIDKGETLNFIDSHAEFTGGQKLLAAISAALPNRRYVRRNTTIISNTMTRERLGDKTVAQLVEPVSSIVWVNPDTESYENLIDSQHLDEETAALIKAAGQKANAGAMRELKKARDKGGILQWAPFSSEVKRVLDSDGNLQSLKAPTLPSQAPGLLARSRYTLTGAYWVDYEAREVRWSVGELIDRDSIDVESRKVRDGIYVERAIGELCIMLAELAGVPVEQSGKVFEVSHHQIDSAHPRNL